MESLHKELSDAETNVKLAEANLNLMKKEVENIRLKIQIKEKENMETNTNGQGEYVWEEFPNVNVGSGDDFYTMPPSTSLEEVKAKCIELGSHYFVAKVSTQKYIRSPPGKKKNKDYRSVHNEAKKRTTNGPSSSYTTYICNYTQG